MITKAAVVPALLVRGWSHESWVNAYFPSDLPSDWRFAYAANDLRAMVVPARDWHPLVEEELSLSLQPSKSHLQAWLDDIPDGFDIYLELEDSSDAPQALSAQRMADFTARLSQSFAGFIQRPHTLQDAMAAGGATWALASSVSSLADQHLQNEPPVAVWVGGTAFSARPDLKALADFFRHLLNRPCEKRPDLIVITEPKVTPTVLSEVRILLELVGESLLP